MAGIRAGHIVTVADLVDGLGKIFVKENSESLTSTTTLQDDDELIMPVSASTNYVFDGYLIYRASTTGDLKLTFTGPTGAVGTWTAGGPNAATSPATDFDSTGNDLGVTRAIAGNGAAADMTCSVRGYLQVGVTAGDLKLRWAQNTLDATATQIRTRSWIRLQKVI